MTHRPALISYIASVLALAVAGSMAVREAFPQAALLALGAAFLIYWGRRLDREERER